MRKVTFLAVCLVLTSVATAAEQFEIENGLRVIIDRRPTARAVQVTVAVRAGRAGEPAEIAGASHFVEHMMFRATSRRPSGGSEREVWREGGKLSAFTREDYTEYGVLLPSHRLDLGLDILSDALIGASFRSDEVEEERRVVLEEIKKRDATPETWAYEEISGLAFLPHPYGYRIIGSASTVGAISRDRLHAYWEGAYRPDRTTVVLVGNVTPDAGVKAVKRWFGAWKRAGEPPAAIPPLPPAFGEYQEATANRAGAAPALLLSVALPPYLHSDYIPSRFLKEILAGWLAQRLVVERRVATTAEAWYTPLVGRNLLRIRLSLPRPEDAARARDELLALLFEMASPEFDYGGIAQVGRYFLSQERLLGEDFERLASVIARADVSGYYAPDGRPEHLAAEDRYSRVEAEDLCRVATTCFRPENIRVLFLLPPGAAPPAPPDLPEAMAPGEAFPPVGEVARIPAPEEGASDQVTPPRASEAVLSRIPDGPTLVQLERRGVPVVSGCIALPAGSRYDPKGKEGLAALTLQTMALATRGDGSGVLRWQLYALGNQHSFATERDTSRILFTVPQEDLREALAVFARTLLEPAFTQEAFEEARGRLLRESEIADERVGHYAGHAFRETLFGAGAYAHERFGDAQSLGRITREDLVAFHRLRYRPQDAIVTLVGEFSPRRARQFVEEAFRLEPAAGPPLPPTPDAPTFAGTRALTHPSGRSYVIIGGSAASVRSPLHAEASLLRLVLGWEAFEEFTNRRSTAYEAGSFYDAFQSAGTFGLYVATSPEQAAETRSGLEAILDRAVEGKFPEGLVDDSKGAWLGGLDLVEVRSDRVALDLALGEARGAGYQSVDRIRERIVSLTPKDLAAACREWFAPEKRVTILVGPEPVHETTPPDER